MEDVEVILFDGSGRRSGTAEASVDDALFAAQTMYDETIRGYKERGSVGFYVDGRLVRLVQGRPQ